MDLVDRYLAAIERHLPRGQREDVIRELSDNISAYLEARETELGRTLHDCEQEAWLQKLGHPLVVASR